jgi:hypothetical protein
MAVLFLLLGQGSIGGIHGGLAHQDHAHEELDPGDMADEETDG